MEGIAIYKKEPKTYSLKDTIASIAMGIGNLAANLLSEIGWFLKLLII